MEFSNKMYQKLLTEIGEVYCEMDDDAIVRIWNDYCENGGNDEEVLHKMWEVDDLLKGMTPGGVIESLNGTFDPSADYITWDGCSITSVDDIWDVISDYEISDYLLTSEETYGEPALIDFWERVKAGDYETSD